MQRILSSYTPDFRFLLTSITYYINRNSTIFQILASFVQQSSTTLIFLSIPNPMALNNFGQSLKIRRNDSEIFPNQFHNPQDLD